MTKKKKTKKAKLSPQDTALATAATKDVAKDVERVHELAVSLAANLPIFPSLQPVAELGITLATQESLITKLVEAQRQAYAPLTAIAELFSPQHLLKGMLDAQANSIKAFAGGIFENPFQGYLDVQKTALAEIAKSPLEEIGKNWVDLTLPDFSSIARVTLDVESVALLPNFPNQYDVVTTTRRTTEVGLVEHELVRTFELKLEILEEKFEAQLAAQDRKLDELLSYFRNEDLGMVKIQSIRLDKQSVCIRIDRKTVPLRHDSKEYQLCEVVLGSSRKATKSWEVAEIVEALHESMDSKDWLGVISRAADRLNSKIKDHAGLDEFFIYSNKHLAVNPHYHGFFELT